MVRSKFSAIPSRNLPVPTFPEGEPRARRPVSPPARFPSRTRSLPAAHQLGPCAPTPLRRVPPLSTPSRPLHPPPIPPDVFLEEQLGCLLRVVPVREGHVLQLDWDIPPTDRLYREAPSNYLSHLLGHEGEGSAFALLKARGWASSLSAGESGNGISSRCGHGRGAGAACWPRRARVACPCAVQGSHPHVPSPPQPPQGLLLRAH
jgi:secreted Zn-dependent insulinase-like peptidase